MNIPTLFHCFLQLFIIFSKFFSTCYTGNHSSTHAVQYTSSAIALLVLTLSHPKVFSNLMLLIFSVGLALLEVRNVSQLVKNQCHGVENI